MSHHGSFPMTHRRRVDGETFFLPHSLRMVESPVYAFLRRKGEAFVVLYCYKNTDGSDVREYAPLSGSPPLDVSEVTELSDGTGELEKRKVRFPSILTLWKEDVSVTLCGCTGYVM